MKLPNISHEHKIFNLVLAGFLLFAILAPLTIRIPGLTQGYARVSWEAPACVVRQRTGHNCPSCGLSRSIVMLYHGNWVLSRSYNPIGYLVVLFILAELLMRLLMIPARLTWIAWLDITQLFVGCAVVGVSILMRM